ncbi:UDP-N-acetylmuramoyl-tripeptide--D-alanyl-D-alanine ligase [Salirhabdus salicampi]|nr:UDP-N-acetylmuramoyl-tripeptide--D-alanyl-D-alanine ligase [Salirhabdus salicampi]MCP8616606.1 UDP-N-acetylmuramoyl-tripeptide--D-alanyl-D-alanine ligase [Salirhabdus salicampi]
MKFTTNWLVKFFPKYKGIVRDDMAIQEIYIDSRQRVQAGLFIPIIGEKFNGHHFIKEVVENGAVAALWQKDEDIPSFLPDDFPLFFVDDTTSALQSLATHYRDEVNPIVIGVTGSNGKTTTKDLFATVFREKYKTYSTKGNFNNHIGLPLTILQMQRDTECLILEMGMNHFGEIERLTKIAKPNVAVITNIGESHIEHLGSREGIAQAKSEIAKGLHRDGLLIVDGDEPLLKPIIQKYHSITVGFEAGNDYRIHDVHVLGEQTDFTVNGLTFSISLLGKHHAKNSSFVIAAAQQYGIIYEKIKKALEHVEMTGMRFEQIRLNSGTTLINDAYNASPTSMIASIDVVKEMNAQRKIVVLGDMFELGEHTKELHKSVAPYITDPITSLYTIGEASKEIGKWLEENEVNIPVYSFTEKDELEKALRKELIDNTIILFKASRGMKLESIIQRLTKD